MLKIIRRVFSFGDWSRTHPFEPPPGDWLDSQFDEIIDKIDGWDQRVRLAIREDGKIAAGAVNEYAIEASAFRKTEEKLRGTLEPAVGAALAAQKTAETALNLAKQALNEAEQALKAANSVNSDILAIQAASEAKLQATNDISAEIIAKSAQLAAESAEIRTDFDDASSQAEAWALSSALWAEHMPDTLPDNAVKIMDITGDHWSARWWANRADNAFGRLTDLYLGAWPDPPATNLEGGPIQVGSIYFDTDPPPGQMYVWNGEGWASMTSPARAAVATLWYSAASGQTAFPLATPDLYGHNFTLSSTQPEPLVVSLNGVKLMPYVSPNGDWTVAGNTVTLQRALRLEDLVAIDIFLPDTKLGPGAVETWSLSLVEAKNGVRTAFTLVNENGTGPVPTVAKNEELLVSLDGVIQEPGMSYSAAAAAITFATAPAADSYAFITWFRSIGGTGVSSGIADAPVDGNTYGRRDADWIEIPGIGGISPTEYNLNTAATVPPPNTNNIRLNTVTQTAVTALYIHHVNAMNVDVSKALAMLRPGNTLLLQDKANSANYQYYNVSAPITDFATYTSVPVAWASGGSPCTAGRIMLAAFGLGAADDVIGGIITIASTAPSSPAVNDVWIDTT